MGTDVSTEIEVKENFTASEPIAERIKAVSPPKRDVQARPKPVFPFVDQAFLPVLFCLVAAALWLYAPIARWLWTAWTTDDYYSHGPLLPLISAYLVWQKRQSLQKLWFAHQCKPRKSWVLVPSALVVCALLMQIVGTLIDMNLVRALQAFSSPLLGLGLARFWGGPAFARELRFPLLFLCFAVPLSGPMVELLTVPMQNHAASAAAMILGLLGLPIQRDNINLFTPTYHFVVAVPCSGLKTSITLLTLSVLVAHVLPDLRQWQRLALVAISIPVALFANTLRVVAIILIGQNYGPKTAEGFLHNWSGLFMFGLSISTLIGLGTWMKSWMGAPKKKKLGTRSKANAEIIPTVPGPQSRSILLKQQWIVVALLLMAQGIGSYLIPQDVGNSHQASGKKLNLPEYMASWRGHPEKIDPVVYEILRPDAIIQKRYFLGGSGNFTKDKANPNLPNVDVLVVYSRDPTGLHSPVTCMRAQGWTLSAEEARVARSGNETVNLSVLNGEQNDQRQQIAYFFSDSSQAVNGRIATFARMMAARFMRKRVGAVEVQFAYSGLCLDRNEQFTPQLQELMVEVSKAVRRDLQNTPN